jgi:hypothetical protein
LLAFNFVYNRKENASYYSAICVCFPVPMNFKLLICFMVFVMCNAYDTILEEQLHHLQHNVQLRPNKRSWLRGE